MQFRSCNSQKPEQIKRPKMKQFDPQTDLETEPRLVYSEAEKVERRALGLPPCEPSPVGILRPAQTGPSKSIRKRVISATDVLNEAADYGSAFTRGLRLDFPQGITHLLISGTASVGPEGETLYPGDFRAQCWRTYRNITRCSRRRGHLARRRPNHLLP